MPRLRLFQVDVFSRQVFHGNPAAVIPLSEWLDNALMQRVAAEINCSETAFFVRNGEGFEMRWFAPTSEVPLCGHATLAAAFLIFNACAPARENVTFDTASGELSVHRKGDVLTLTLPSISLVPCEPPDAVLEGLGASPCKVLRAEADPNYVAVFEREATVRSADPDLSLLEQLHPYGVALTAPGDDVDFVSRYFAPSYGIPEDPATGSIHAALAPYWAARLGAHRLHARQLSQRGGELFCELRRRSVNISGHAVKALEGYFYY